MKIQINGIDNSFERNLQFIANLFYENSSITFEQPDACNLNTTINIEGTNQMLVTAVMVEVISGKQISSHYEKTINEPPSSKKWRREVKHAVNYVFLDVLQQLTGMIQDWGTLTGIRPTKLFHRQLNLGYSPDQVEVNLRSDYMIQSNKLQLMQTIVDQQLNAIPDLYSLKNEVSVYIGIPFCPTKCAYCTFPAYGIHGLEGHVTSFLSGLHYEIQEIGRWLNQHGVAITTVYFGGGTPTSIRAEEMDLLYEVMYESFPNMNNVREVTVEAGRPDTITREKLDVLKKWKIDRISINPQSYRQETLKAIGRHHTVEETIEKFKLARDMGISNINMDLIIGLPGEGTKEFEHTLGETAKLMPESLTVHTLSYKRASEMTKNKEKYKVANRDEITVMMEMANDWTSNHRYKPYYLYRQKNILGNLENIGYSLNGHESLYNILIMEEQQTILGLGCGAASKFVDPNENKITRFANPKDPKTYNAGFCHYTNEKITRLDEMFSK